MHLNRLSFGLVLCASIVLSACSATVDKPQARIENDPATLEMLASMLNSRCSEEGFVAGNVEHTECVWQLAQDVREQLLAREDFKHEELWTMNNADKSANRKFRNFDNYENRRALQDRQAEYARTDRKLSY